MGSALSSKLLTANEHAGIAIRGGLGYGTAYFLAKHCHAKKDMARVPLAAALLKIIPAAVALFHGDVEKNGYAALGLTALDGIGQGAVDFYGVVHGLRSARQQKGVKPILVPFNAKVDALPAGSIQDAQLVGSYDEVTLGALGVAQPGASMNRDKLREFQSYR